MRKLSSLITGAALALTAGALGCVNVDPLDPFDSLTTIANETSGDGDGDGDATTTGDGDGDATTTGDGDGDACGGAGSACGADTDCCTGFACNPDGTCGFPTGDGDGDATTGGDPMWGDGPYYGNPPNCQADEVPLMDGQLPVAGGHCSPVAMCTDAMCTNTDACPPAPADSTAQPAILWVDNNNNNYCGLLCMVDADPTQCPAGATCKDLMNPQAPGYGACTYP